MLAVSLPSGSISRTCEIRSATSNGLASEGTPCSCRKLRVSASVTVENVSSRPFSMTGAVARDPLVHFPHAASARHPAIHHDHVERAIAEPLLRVIHAHGCRDLGSRANQTRLVQIPAPLLRLRPGARALPAATLAAQAPGLRAARAFSLASNRTSIVRLRPLRGCAPRFRRHVP